MSKPFAQSLLTLVFLWSVFSPFPASGRKCAGKLGLCQNSGPAQNSNGDFCWWQEEMNLSFSHERRDHKYCGPYEFKRIERGFMVSNNFNQNHH